MIIFPQNITRPPPLLSIPPFSIAMLIIFKMTITSNQGRNTGIKWIYFSFKKKDRFVLFF